MPQKAVVLCAGEGSRLRPLTFSRPKHLLPVAGKPILGWALDAIREAGIDDVALIVGHQAEAIRQYVGAGDAWDISVEYITQVAPLGIGHAVNLARDYVAGAPFLVYLGDNLFEEGISGFVERIGATDWEAALMLKSVDDPRRFGVARMDEDRVVEVVEKPANPPSNLAIVGVYAFRSTVFEAIDSLEPSARGEIEITDAIQRLIQGGVRVTGREVHGIWEDAGEPAALLRTNREWLARMKGQELHGKVEGCTFEGPVSIDAGAIAVNSRFIGPCKVGANCTIRDSEVGPDVAISEGCEVIETRLRNCIVQRNSQIRHLAAGLVDSVLGEHVEVQGRPGDNDGAPLSLLLGDMAHARAMN